MDLLNYLPGWPLLREELRDVPKTWWRSRIPRLSASAALVAGEPQRALAALKALTETTSTDQAVHRVARLMDSRWFPGDVGGVSWYEEDEDDHPFDVPREDLVTALLMAHADLYRARELARFYRNASGPLVPELQRPWALASADEHKESLEKYIQQIESTAVRAADSPYDRFAPLLILGLADLVRHSGDDHRARFYLTTARQAYERTDDLVGLARCLLFEGDALATPQSSPEALGFDLVGTSWPRHVPAAAALSRAEKYYKQAQRQFRGAGSARGEAAARLRRAFLALLENEPETAANRLKKAKDLFAAARDRASVHLADVHLLVGAVAAGRFSALSPPPLAELKDWRHVGSRSFACGLGRIFTAAGENWLNHGDLERARVAVAAGVEYALHLNDASGFSRGANAANQVASRLNRHTLVGVLAHRVINDRFPKLKSSNFDYRHAAYDIFTTCTEAFISYHQTANPDGMKYVRKQARKLLDIDAEQQVLPPHFAERLELTSSEAKMMELKLRGDRARYHGSFDEAERLYARALECAEASPIRGTPMEPNILAAIGSPSVARERTRKLTKKQVITPIQAATLFVELGDFRAADHVLRKAPDPEASKHWPVVSGRTALGLGRHSEAWELFTNAITAFEESIGRLAREDFRLSMANSGSIGELYMGAARAAIVSKEIDESWMAGDRLRSLALNEALTLAAKAHEAPKSQVGAILNWSQASGEWTGALDILGSKVATMQAGGIADAERDLEDKQLKLEAAEVAVDDAAPGFLAERRRSALNEPVPRDLRKLLPADTLLIEYLASRNRLLTWLIDCDGGFAWDDPIDRTLPGRVRRYRDRCAGFPRNGDDAEDDENVLTDVLLAHAADYLSNYRRLIVVPFGAMSTLPFHALPVDGAALGLTHVVSYLPAASVLPYAAHRSRPRLGRGCLVIGNPSYNVARRLPRLPGAGVEARAIGERLGCQSLTDRVATERTVRTRIPGAPVLHFATHGFASPVAPTTSSLALAGNGELTVADLMGIRLDADLAVLSACDTGRGMSGASGDVVGLVRGLLAAGARSAVVSLWPVDDEATCVLMTAFYQRLLDGEPTADALAQAQASIEKLGPAERRTEFDTIASSVRQAVTPTGRRSREAPSEQPRQFDAQNSTYFWAPFIHVGL